jgi:hypothetical protein
MATASIRQVIFSPADHFKQITTVAGCIVLLDLSLDRMDISDGGAKIIVQVAQVPSMDRLTEGSRVLVTGRVKKQQRRTYIEAEAVEVTGIAETDTGTEQQLREKHVGVIDDNIED